MDRNFLEFWGRLLLAAAAGQQQLDHLAQWMQHGYRGMASINDLFSQCYGLPGQADDHRATADWQRAVQSFENDLADMAAWWGWVPASVHLPVKQERDALKRQVDAQAQTIAQLRRLLDDKGWGQLALADRFQRLVSDQQRQYDALMQTFQQTFGPSAADDDQTDGSSEDSHE